MGWLVFRQFVLTPPGILLVLVLLIGSFYGIENWRGERAWRACRGEFEGRGEHLDWSRTIPPEVPDDENFYAAPGMKGWFQKDSGESPPRIFEWPEREPSWDALMETGPVVLAPNGERYPATVLIEWFDRQYAEEMALLRQACERPKGRLLTDYQNPLTGPYPTFVNFRTAAQVLAARADAHRLLGQPDRALDELTVLRRLMERSDDHETLVGSMIRTAIGGLYLKCVEQAFLQGHWGETHWAPIRRDVESLQFLSSIERAMRLEVAMVNHAAEHDWASLFMGDEPGSGASISVWTTNPRRALERLPWKLMPKGWRRQNQIIYTRSMFRLIDANSDSAAQRVYPGRASNAWTVIAQVCGTRSPFHLLAAISVPNYMKAYHVVARQQTLANQVAIVCALDGFKAAHGTYPESLEALVPEFIPAVPHDIIDGALMRYVRDQDGTFLLYSVGWDESDDGGTAADWVWSKSDDWR